MENQEQMEMFSKPYAGFWIRFWAYIVDLIVISGLSFLLDSLFTYFQLDKGNGIFSAFQIGNALVFYLYFVIMTKKFGQTLGKMIFAIKVISVDNNELTWGTVLFREWIGRYISASILILYLFVAFLPKKQGIHDYFADTVVIHEHFWIRKPAHTM
jgi:uncharacterized RDD family membrane protein YckC